MLIFQGVPAHKKDMKKRPENKRKEMYGKVKPFLEGRFYQSLSFKNRTPPFPWKFPIPNSPKPAQTSKVGKERK